VDQEKISVDRIDDLMRLVFEELRRLGGRGRPKDVLAAIEGPGKITEYEKQRTLTGAIRWDTHLRFYTTDCVKAGYLIKANGYWNLTSQREEALKLPKGQLIRSAQKLYRAWKKTQPKEEIESLTEQTVETDAAVRQTIYEKGCRRCARRD
jgi:restriction system protein